MPLQYVILHHTGRGEPHYDLMFETSPGSELATWRSDSWPITNASKITPLPNHRRAYLEYEGPISNNRGIVQRIYTGQHTILENRPAHLKIALEDKTQLKLLKE